jgi:hypothetical protein
LATRRLAPTRTHGRAGQGGGGGGLRAAAAGPDAPARSWRAGRACRLPGPWRRRDGPGGRRRRCGAHGGLAREPSSLSQGRRAGARRAPCVRRRPASRGGQTRSSIGHKRGSRGQIDRLPGPWNTRVHGRGPGAGRCATHGAADWECPSDPARRASRRINRPSSGGSRTPAASRG